VSRSLTLPRPIKAHSAGLPSVDVILVAVAGLFALVVQSGFFTTSDWMLGDLAYHRGVAYTMQAGSLQGEGPYRDLITYYGGLFPLAFGTVAAWLGLSFDALLSVVSWFAGLAWVMAVYALGRRLWPTDRLTVGAFVLLATVAVPFSAEKSAIWVNSTLASSQNYWPLYPRDVALMLMVLTAAALLEQGTTRRVVISGLLIGAMVMFHIQLAVVTGWFAAASIGWASLRARQPLRLLELAAIAGIALLVSAWWWIPRVGPTLASGSLLLTDYPDESFLSLGLLSYLTNMGLAGVLSLLGFALLVARRFRSPAATLLLVWACSILALLVLDWTISALGLISERRLWLVFSIPATAAAAVGATELLRLLPRPAAAALLVAAAVSLLPGSLATFQQVRTAWIEGQAGQVTFETATWRPLWQSLNQRVRSQHGLVLGTYDTYAVWTWSFSGAQPVSVWLPGYVKLGFDPAAVTGLSYLDREQILTSAFAGRDAMCDGFSRVGATTFLLDRNDGLIATYDRTPAMDYRVDPSARTLGSTEREVSPGVVYEDQNSYDLLLMSAGGSYHIDWVDRKIKRLVIVAQLATGSDPAMTVRAGEQMVRFRASSAGRASYVVETPSGVTDGITIHARRNVRLFRISAFTRVPGMSGPDGPFIVGTDRLCR
jgi:hypothetical protein